jgi:hypothetical protein
MQATAMIAAIAGASAYIALFKLLPVDRTQAYQAATRPVPLPPAAPTTNFRLPANFGGGSLVDTLA